MLACTNLKYFKKFTCTFSCSSLGLGACLRLCLPPFQTTKCKNKTKKQGIEYKHEYSVLKLYYTILRRYYLSTWVIFAWTVSDVGIYIYLGVRFFWLQILGYNKPVKQDSKFRYEMDTSISWKNNKKSIRNKNIFDKNFLSFIF